MRSIVLLIALLASLGLAACGGNDKKGSSTSTPATTSGTTAATTGGTTTPSSKPAAVNAACKQAFPAAGKLSAEYVYDNVVPQAEKIAAAADKAGEQAFGVDISDYAQEQAAIDRAARDPKPLEKATAVATAEASKIGAPACVKYIKAYRQATASK